MEELVLGEVARELGVVPFEVMKMGYFEVHRTWLIIDELKARDLQQQHMILDAAQATQEYRTEIWEWLQRRQPRSNPPLQDIPKDLIDRIKENWNKRD